MPTSYTSLLGLALPVTGELSGTWGDTVNDYISQYVDAAVAGTQTISGSQTAVTLSKTTGTSLSQAGSGATGSSQYQIINCTGNPAGLLTITAPAASRAYLVLNNTSTSQSVKIVGVGPTTGITVATAQAALVAWNGSDFELVASTDISTLSGTLPVSKGGTGLTSGTSGGIPYYSGTTTIASSAALAANALVVGGGAGVAPSTVTTGTGVVTALGVNTGTAGAFVVNGGALGTPSSGTVTNLTGTASININGTVGATTANTGAFTSITSTSASGILTRAAATQDGVELIGRAGGTSSYKVTFTPTTLSASRTVTLPNADINFTTGLGVANGGTGATTLTANNVILGNGTSAVQFVAPGSSGNLLTSNGTTWQSTTPSFSTLSGNNAFTGANTFYNGTGQTFGTATSTQDGVILAGRAGGTTSLRVTLQPGTLTASRTLTLPDATTTVTGTDATQTLTNKRIDPRVSSTASASSVTPDVASFDMYAYTALAAALTINAPTGTPVDGTKLMFRLLDNGTARALTWNATYTAIGVTLPTTTVINKTTYVGCVYNAGSTRWDVIAVTTQA